jgi:threonine synthase
VSSNFERLLFEASGQDPGAVQALMSSFARDGYFSIPTAALNIIRTDFSAETVDEAACSDEMGRVFRESGIVVDPHSAVGLRAARAALRSSPATPVIALGTAHPAKFPDAVARATGVRPALPEYLADLFDREEKISVLPNEAKAVAAFLRETARAPA